MAVAGFGEIAEQLRRSTVLIHAGGRGCGSGVIWSSNGAIITNAHVARGAQIYLQLWDGRAFPATVASRDPHRDLAELRIDATNLPSALVADSSQVRPGELVLAIGNPLGFVGALTTGVIHAVGPVRGHSSRSWVQADVRLAPGNSGGPLADVRGRVIGINTMIAGGLALAIPSNLVLDFLSAGPFDAWLGVTVHPVRIPRSNAADGSAHTFGLLLLEVEPRSPAASASLLPGDILLGTEEKPFTSVGDLSQALQSNGPRLLRLEFLRGDYSRVRRVTVQLGGQAASRSSVAA
jgi:serine protease Do